MAFTLNNIASNKDNSAAKRGDSIRVNIKSIKVVDGFNVRINDDELREHVAGIAGALTANLPIPPIEVWVNPETGDIELVDGHCRFHAYQQYAEMTSDFDGYISAVKFDGTPFQRKMRIASSNKQLKLKPVELGRLYIAARDEHGATRQEIAAEAGMSLAHIDQMILLASAKPEVLAAVDSGSISATEAVKLTREHGDDAPAELERRQEAAKDLGKDKVTAKVAAPKKTAPNRSKVDMVVSNAVVLVNGLGKSLETAISVGECPEMIEVSAMALADLIMAVNDMRESGKALDADRQVELPIE
jgi:ParB family transcriptional regulator, chromosome partitioning protein